jgi:hypothetical protein
MVLLFLTKGMDGAVQLFATLANKIPEAGHSDILGSTRNIGARPCIVQRSLEAEVSRWGRVPIIYRRSGDACREGVIPHPIIGMRAVKIESGRVSVDDHHRCRIWGCKDGIAEGRSTKAP